MPETHLARTSSASPAGACPTCSGSACGSSDLLDRAGVKPAAKAVRFMSFDGTYTESLTLSQARRNDVHRRLRAGGRRLSGEHGGPVRMYVAPMYGYKSCKWLDTIELTDKVEPGYWEQRGYDVDGWVGHSDQRRRTDRTAAELAAVRPRRAHRALGQRVAVRHPACSPARSSTSGRSRPRRPAASSCGRARQRRARAPGRAARRPAGRWGRALRKDFSRLGRFDDDKRRWLRRRTTRAGSASSTPGRS